MKRRTTGQKSKPKKKPQPKPKPKRKPQPKKAAATPSQERVVAGMEAGELRTPEDIEAAYRQMGLYRDTIAVERAWLDVERSRESLRRDGLLGVPMDRLQGTYATVLTDSLVLTLATYVRDGNTLNTAARAAGVPAALLRHWIREGLRVPNSPCGRMVAVLDRAAALAEANAVSRVFNGKAGWRSSLQYLNRVAELKFKLRQSDVLEAEAETQAHHDEVKEQAPIDVDRAALVMALIESAAGPGKPDTDDDEEPAHNVIEIKSA